MRAPVGEVVHEPCRDGLRLRGGTVERPGSFLLRGRPPSRRRSSPGWCQGRGGWMRRAPLSEGASGEVEVTATTSKRSSRASPAPEAAAQRRGGRREACRQGLLLRIHRLLQRRPRRGEGNMSDHSSRSDEWPGPPGTDSSDSTRGRFPPVPGERGALLDYWTVLSQRRRTVALVFLAAVLTAFVWSMTARRYTPAPRCSASKGGAADPQVRADRARRRRGEQTQLQTYHRLCSAARSPTGHRLVNLEHNPEFGSVGVGRES